MPRATVKLSPTREEPPAWWADEFRARQDNIRTRLLVRFPRLGRPATASEIRQNVVNSTFGRREIQHVLDALVAQGILRFHDENRPYNHGSAFFRSMRYYELVEQS